MASKWEKLITPRLFMWFITDDLGKRMPARRIASPGRSIGLVLGGGGAASAHLGVLDELERVGVTIDRFAGTSMWGGYCGVRSVRYGRGNKRRLRIRVLWPGTTSLSDYAFPVS